MSGLADEMIWELEGYIILTRDFVQHGCTKLRTGQATKPSISSGEESQRLAGFLDLLQLRVTIAALKVFLARNQSN